MTDVELEALIIQKAEDAGHEIKLIAGSRPGDRIPDNELRRIASGAMGDGHSSDGDGADEDP